jgi:signal transduction histidine kinase
VLFKTQQRLARSERLAVVGQIAASLAHEIGTPLNAISGHVELLAANHPNHADTQRRTKIIDRQLDFIVGTVKRLLEWTHKKRVVFEPLDINALIEELLWLVSPTLEKNSVAVELKQESELPLIQAHRDSLQQVFLNLINNSIDAMPSGGQIEITTSRNSSACAEIVFRDSGAGIGQDAAQHLFEPYHACERKSLRSALLKIPGIQGTPSVGRPVRMGTLDPYRVNAREGAAYNAHGALKRKF